MSIIIYFFAGHVNMKYATINMMVISLIYLIGRYNTMKNKRIISVCLCFAMIFSVVGAFPAMSDSSVIRSYFDFTMENWTEASDRLNSDGTTVQQSLSGTTDGSWNLNAGDVVEELVFDAERNSKVWKLTKQSAATGNRSRIRFDAADKTFERNTLWTEITFKYEGGFAGLGWEYNMAVAPVYIDNSGNIRKFAYNFFDNQSSGAIISSSPLELEKWYTLSVAIDYPNAPNADGGPLYVWLNGEKIFDGTDYNSNLRLENSNGTAASPFNYIDFNFCRPDSAASTVYIDNFKMYTTATLDNHPETDFSGLSIEDADSGDDITVSGDRISATAETTVADLKKALTFPGNTTVTFTKDGETASDSDTVSGCRVCVNSDSTDGYKVYYIYADASRTISQTYFDMDMDNWASTSDKKNYDGTSVSGFDWVSSFAPKADSVESNELFGGKSWVITDSEGSTGHYARARYNATIPTFFDSSEVLWTEITLKFEGQFAPLGWEHDAARSPIHIGSDGKLYRFGRWVYNATETGKNYDGGTPLDYQLKLGHWYTISVALDFTKDASGTGAPLYVWVNGEKIASGTDTVSELKAGGSFKYIDFWIDQVASGETTVWVDSFRLYTTETLDKFPESVFEGVTLTDANSSDDITVKDSYISAPDFVTASGLLSAVSCPADCTISFVRGNSLILGDSLVNRAYLYVISNTTGGYKGYEINPECSNILGSYFNMNMDNWTGTSQKLNIDSSSVSGFGWATGSFAPTSDSLATDIRNGGKSWVVTEDTNGTGHYARARFNSGIPKNFESSYVLWTEISLKFEGEFTPAGWEHDMAVAPVYVDSDGMLRKFVQRVYNDSDKLGEYVGDGYRLELGKWYHIVAALDFAGADAGSGAPLYVWVNGERIEDGESNNSNIKSGAGFNYYDLWIDKPISGASTVWVDNFSSYLTADVDDHAEKEFEGLSASDANLTDEITISGNIISTPAGTKLSDIKSAITFADGTLGAYTWNGLAMTGDDEAQDVVLYVTKMDSPAFGTYYINPYTFSEKIYFDMNMENWQSADDRKNTDGTTVLGADGDTFEWDELPKSQELSSDRDKKSNVLCFTPGINTKARLELDDKNFEKNVLWSELSFKFDGSFSSLGWNFSKGTAPFYVDFDGYMKYGDGNLLSDSYVLETGVWYHVAVAIDSTGVPIGQGGKLDVWINGAKLASGIPLGEDFSLVDVKKDESGNIVSAQISENLGYIELFARASEEAEGKISIDNFRFYTSEKIDDHPRDDFEDVIVSDTDSADFISVFGYKITVPEGTSVGDVKKAFKTDGSISISRDGASADVDEEADGCTVYVNSPNGIGFKIYKVEASISKDNVLPIKYYEIDFDCEADWNTKWVNKANPGHTFEYISAMSSIEKNAPSPVLTKEPDGDGNSLFLSASGNQGSWHIGEGTDFTLSDADYSNCTMWYEISFKFIDSVIPLSMDATGNIFEITSDGKLFVAGGSVACTTSSGEEIILASDKWHRLGVAMDSTGDGTRVYTWLDGEELKFPENLISSLSKAEGFGITFNFDGSGKVLVDNIRVYAYGKEAKSGLEIFNGTKDVDSDNITVEYFNNTDGDITHTLIACAYGYDNEMLALTKLDNHCLRVGYGKIAIPLPESEEKPVTYKLFVWDSLDDCMALASNVIISTSEESQMINYAVNPFLPGYEYVPDGEPYVFGDRLYVFGSHDTYNSDIYCDERYMGWSAPVDDLSDWRFEGEIFNRADDPNYKGGEMMLHAPDVAKGADGRYYLYYSINGTGALGVAVCDTPAGHYEYYGRISYSDGTTLGSKTDDPMPLDPGIFVDDDGRVYLYMGYVPSNPSYTNLEASGRKIQGCFCVELSSDMKTIISDARLIAPGWHTSDGTSFEGYGFFEAASMRKINEKYYFIYSPDSGTNLCYATGDSPVGPFTFGGVIVNNTDYGYKGNTRRKAIPGNNHGSVACVDGQYYIFYHRQTGSGLSRQACAEKIYINEDGSIDQVCVTSCGLSSVPLPAKGSYSAHIACNLITSSAKYVQDKPDGDVTAINYISNIRNGDVVGYKYFSFSGKNKFTVNVKSYTSGSLRIYTDDEMTVPMAQIGLNPHLDVKSYTVDVAFEDGIYPLYLVYEGDGEIELYNISFE